MSKFTNIKKEIVIDTGPLLVILAEHYGHNTLTKFGYTDDYVIVLKEFLKDVSKIIITPQVLAEVSNLVNTKIEKVFFSDFINFSKSILQELKEEYISKDIVLAKKELPKFGFTDASLLEVANGNKLLLTNDALLHYYCRNNNISLAYLREIVEKYRSTNF
ncbi:MAG: hypothetical protein CVT88_09640 [Candidatus Altiarchaeales archaeon HGW-Altiarchaeales-1]|nr:MAG: hypothetical protein CVT88_09640 [Candidatus Altiarchaeales archaeon HGW-Altiarchaeales-1]PKP57260.1 MAG: hypothetical protein CVT89_04805 [Candidatus Altiarchaeales archaeon HGW-Altiarchaeales-2]